MGSENLKFVDRSVITYLTVTNHNKMNEKKHEWKKYGSVWLCINSSPDFESMLDAIWII